MFYSCSTVCKLTSSESKCVFQFSKSEEASVLLLVQSQEHCSGAGLGGVPAGPYCTVPTLLLSVGQRPPGSLRVTQPCCKWFCFKTVPSPLTINIAVSSENMVLLCSWAQLKFFCSPLPDWLFTSLSSHSQEWKGQRKELGKRGREWKHHSSCTI